jgi:hypothetical protein
VQPHSALNEIAKQEAELTRHQTPGEAASLRVSNGAQLLASVDCRCVMRNANPGEGGAEAQDCWGLGARKAR